MYKNNILTLLILDFILLPLALFTSVLLRLGGGWDYHLNHALWIFVALPLWTIPIFINLGLYKAVIEYIDEKVVAIVFLGVTLSVLILITIIHFTKLYAFPKTSIIIFWVFALAYIGGSRLIIRGFARRINYRNKIKVAIYGAGNAGIQTCIALQSSKEYSPIAFFDDQPKKWNKTIRGLSVYNPKKIEEFVTKKQINQILVALPSIAYSKRQEIIKQLEPLSILIKTLPGISNLVSGKITINDIKEVDIEDILGRETIPANQDLLHKNITDKTVLVTGGGGSIGSELSRQIAQLRPDKLILLDCSEFALYQITQEINAKYPDVTLINLLGDITKNDFMEIVFQKFSIDTIFHAAAYKHVPLVEYNPLIGIYNNSIGTFVIASLAAKYQVKNMVLISTDKAVRPTNVMGASKRLAEIILQAFNQYNNDTIFTMVRFGNVLGSSGSVVPLFKQQIKDGGPITITHPDIIRYFMTIPEAANLVIQAGSMATGGEVFVLDMGEPVKIRDLAERMIHLSGLTVKSQSFPEGDIAISYTSLRPGEKLFEELLIGSNPQTTEHPRIMQATENFIPYNQLINKINLLKTQIENCDVNQALITLKQLVPEYHSQKIISLL